MDLEARLFHAEREAERWRATYTAVVETSPDAVLIMAYPSRRIVAANAAAVEMLGYTLPELLRMSGRDLVPREEVENADRVDAVVDDHGTASNAAVHVRRKNGALLACDLRLERFQAGPREQLAAILRDITSQIEQRNQLEQADRLAAIGRMSAGIAHEVNNPAMVVLANTEAADFPLSNLEAFVDHIEELGGAHSETRELLDTLEPRQALAELRTSNAQISDAIQRVASIVKDLVRFTRVDSTDKPVRSDLNEIIHAAVTMTKPQVRGRATIEVLQGALPSVMMRDGAIGQIIVNLVSNATQAIESDDPSTNRITIQTGTADGGVFCTVTDTGAGIADDHRPRIFESLFTTKAAGHGTGLGLSISARIAHEHGGTLALQSTGPEGSVFRLWLPDSAAIEDEPSDQPFVPSPVGRLRVLIVDDEADVRSSLVRLLGAAHEVVSVESGERALEVLRDDTAFDVILCDVIMPGVDGPAFYAALEAEDEALAARVVFMTGGLPSPRARAFVEERGDMVVGKPVTRDALHHAFARLARRDAARS